MKSSFHNSDFPRSHCCSSPEHVPYLTQNCWQPARVGTARQPCLARSLLLNRIFSVTEKQTANLRMFWHSVWTGFLVFNFSELSPIPRKGFALRQVKPYPSDIFLQLQTTEEFWLSIHLPARFFMSLGESYFHYMFLDLFLPHLPLHSA